MAGHLKGKILKQITSCAEKILIYLVVQVILVFFLGTEPAVVLLCAVILSVSELSEVKLRKCHNVKPQRKCCRKWRSSFESVSQHSDMVCWAC